MSRFKLLCLWALITVMSPVLLFAMLVQASLGSDRRAKAMAIAYDECGNALFGGPPQQTISARTGNALILGDEWGKWVAPIIDTFFGRGHCLSNVDVPPTSLDEDQRVAIRQAYKDQELDNCPY